jgi:hypothetical protein
MRRMILTLVFVTSIGAYAYAQTGMRPSVSLELLADVVTTTPVNGYDGVIRSGRAQHVTTASGNVLLVINGIQVTADTAVWYEESNEIALGSGGALMRLPGPPTSLRIRVTR